MAYARELDGAGACTSGLPGRPWDRTSRGYGPSATTNAARRLLDDGGGFFVPGHRVNTGHLLAAEQAVIKFRSKEREI
jgi:hypothetical protein